MELMDVLLGIGMPFAEVEKMQGAREEWSQWLEDVATAQKYVEKRLATSIEVARENHLTRIKEDRAIYEEVANTLPCSPESRKAWQTFAEIMYPSKHIQEGEVRKAQSLHKESTSCLESLDYRARTVDFYTEWDSH